MITEITEFRTVYKQPDGVWLCKDGVRFYAEGSWTILYKWACKKGQGEQFLKEMDFLWLPKYYEALRLKEEDEARRIEQHESWMEQLRLKQNAKRRERRMRMKNGISTPENAVPVS